MLSTNSLSTCIIITVFVLLFVVLVPIIDTFYCRKLGLNVHGGVSDNLYDTKYLNIRMALILLAFAVYIAGLLYFTFFSRSAAADYLIHIAPFQDFANSFRIDFGILGTFYYILNGDFETLSEHVGIVNFAGIAQVYLNIMLFIPMGYLLPYIWKWFRKKILRRVIPASFLISLAVENIQLISRHGYYDVDDLVTNTLGGCIGGLLFIAFAFRVTHPDWRKDLKRYRRWKKNAKTRTLYPFARKIDLSRTVLFATDESLVWDFYVMNLGFRVVKQLVPEDDTGTSFLLELGSSQVEIICSNKQEELLKQYLIITVSKMDKVWKRLEENGIRIGPYEQDPYTGAKCFKFDAPDNVCVIVLEE